MTRAAALLSFFVIALLPAADFSSYRGFEIGAKLPVVAKHAGVEPGGARVIHQRPAVIQELDWRPAQAERGDASKADSVREGLLRFYNGELFQIVVTYDRQKVEGMTEADMVEVISRDYGMATKPAVEIPYVSNYGDVATVLARWQDTEHCYDLVRTGDRTSFALIASSKRLNTAAQAAIQESVRLDAVEAPQRAIDRQKKQDAEGRLVLDKARLLNKPNFRP